MYLVFTHMPDELPQATQVFAVVFVLVFPALINSLVCLYYRGRKTKTDRLLEKEKLMPIVNVETSVPRLR